MHIKFDKTGELCNYASKSSACTYLYFSTGYFNMIELTSNGMCMFENETFLRFCIVKTSPYLRFRRAYLNDFCISTLPRQNCRVCWDLHVWNPSEKSQSLHSSSSCYFSLVMFFKQFYTMCRQQRLGLVDTPIPSRCEFYNCIVTSFLFEVLKCMWDNEKFLCPFSFLLLFAVAVTVGEKLLKFEYFPLYAKTVI